MDAHTGNKPRGSGRAASEKYRVLVVEDNPADADLAREALPETGPVSFGVEVAPRLSDAIERLKRGGLDLIIVDLGLPDSQGLETFRRIRDAAPHVATIVLTGSDDLEKGISAVRDGAQDYLVKGRVGGGVLLRTARYAVERKRMEAALKSTQRLLSETERLGKVGGWEFDIDTRSMTWTEEVYRIHEVDPGCQPDVDEGIAFYAPVSRPTIERAVQRAIDHGEPFDLELEIVTAKGNLRCVHAIGRTEQGKRRVYGFFQDITERKLMETALRESEELLKESQLVAGLGSYRLDIPAGTWKSSPVLDRTFGIGQSFARTVEGWLTLVHPEDRAMMAAYFRDEILGLGRAFDREYRIIRHGDQVERWVHGLGKVVCDTQGRALKMYGTIQDITERKRAEVARERLTVAIEQAADSVVITDTEGTIQYVNPVFETVTGYSRPEVIGKNPRFLASGAQDKAFYRNLWETISSGRVWEGRMVNRRKDGTHFTEDATIAAVRDGAGRITSYVAVKRDVTEHLRAAEEKIRLEDQLRQAQKVDAIGRLAGGVAHDFNNLTAIVLGYGEMLLGQLGAEDPARNAVEQIVAAGRRSATLTRQLLAFSRKQTLQPEALEPNALLRNLGKMLGRVIGEDIQLEFVLAEDLGRVMADPGQLEQVVVNLAVNARDAMPGGGRLTVETTNVELDETYVLGHESVIPGKYVMLALTDTGCGMDKAAMAKLFEPFYTTKEKGKGTGLGLSTVYGIVKQSGGYIWAYSEPGRGTSFKIYLPRTEAEPAVKPDEAGGVSLRGGGERILLVEDERSLRELCASVLLRLGYRVSAAASGPEALRLMERERLELDLVLTDVIMPGLSGVELADRLREERPGLKVLYMSGYPDEAIARHGVLEAGTPFIQKPFSERDLAAKVRAVLAGKAAGVAPVRRVLMIDDDEQFRDLVGRFCRKRGHVFAGGDSAAAALAALAEQPFDVLLIDLNIPGTSGEAVLREIRAAGHTAPAIVLTGDVASADMEVLRMLGAVRAVQKSSDPGQLLQAIDAA